MDPSPDTRSTTDEVLVTSRSFAEYVAFFGLDPHALPGRVLDCCAGASGFVAEACARGVDAVAADPTYAQPVDLLARRTSSDTVGAAAMVDAHASRFTYEWYGAPQRRAELRSSALTTFEEHRRTYPDRYVAAALPVLPFGDRAFDLALCSHLLFTWSTHFDEQWHLEALVELCRVAVEVRVFPLVRQATGEPVDFLPGLRARLREEAGISSEVVVVPYEFQVGAHHMLTLRG